MRNSRTFATLFLLACCALGCGGGKASSSSGAAPPSLREFLSTHESTFRPSLYDLPTDTLKSVSRAFNDSVEAIVVAPAAAETIPGFRVQVLLTQDIDQATSIRQVIASSLPEEWVYLVYDLPYYKVRVGNYADREAANLSVKKLVSLGYPDAWVVPDKVLRNPPLPPPPVLPDSSGN